ncbi:MAG: hypothetical protein U0836_21335 [Pirellulales bacterium]
MRRKLQSEDSLELLLDIICNTFGGVLFMAILIAVLLKNHRLEKKPAESSAPAASAADVAAVQAELHRLQAAAEAQAQLKVDLSARQNELALALDELRTWEARRQTARTERDRLRGATASERAELDKQRLDQATLEERLETEEAELALLRGQLADEQRRRTRSATLPRERTTLRSERGVVVRYGRLYTWHRYSAAGEQLGVNTEDMFLHERADGHYGVTPKPYAGVAIGDNPQDEAAVRRKLAEFDPDRNYLAVIVWEDSFADFQRFRNQLVADGWEYRLMLAGPESEIVDRGGSGGKVQ